MSDGGRKLIGFYCLPLEIREEIYFYLLFGRAVFIQYLHFEADSWVMPILEDPERRTYFIPTKRTSILSVSRQISAEALDVLYGRNLFVVRVSDGGHNKLLNFGIANIRRIRYLILVAQPMGVCFPEPMQLDSQLWVSLLMDLKQLYLVAQLPLYVWLGLENQKQEWIAWLEPILQYLAQNITERAAVGLDDNDLVGAGNVIKRCLLLHSHYKVRTVTGDIIAKRSWHDMYDDL